MRKKLLSLVLAVSLLLGIVPALTTTGRSAPVTTYSTSQAGVDLIKGFEGFTQYKVWDVQHYTIGYGTGCGKDDYPNGITREEAEVLLRATLAGMEKKVNAFLTANGIQVTQEQFDALLSFTYNVGAESWLSGCRLSRLLQKGEYTAAEFASAFGVWCHVGTEVWPGLVTRRVREIQLFLHGDYTGKVAPPYVYIMFDAAGGKRTSDIYFFPQGEAYGPLQLATREGYRFLGWYTADGTQVTEETVADKNISVTARWLNVTGGSMGARNEVSWTFSEERGELVVTGEEISATQPIYAASYDEKGRMLDFAILSASGAMATFQDAATIRLFWLDGNLIPKCAPGIVF